MPLPLGSLLRYNLNMPKSIRVIPKKRGRPATGKDPLYGVRIPDALMASIKRWAKANGSPSRSDAMRQLLERALAGKSVRRPLSKEAARKASKLAARELEKLDSPSLPEPDLQQRKRALIRGPKEFRDIRADLPKPKS